MARKSFVVNAIIFVTDEKGRKEKLQATETT